MNLTLSLNSMKTLLSLCAVLTGTTLFAALPNQATLTPIPAGFDNGAFSVQETSLGAADPDRAIAFDNFSLGSDYNLSGISWTGVYAEPLPGARSDTDFIVQIWADDAGKPDLGAGPVMDWTFEAGPVAGSGGPDLTVTSNGILSNATATQIGGGEGFDYSGAISGTLAAGDYWISIVADQSFLNATPIVDPEWIWHQGVGHDGFYAADLRNDPPGTPAYGILQSDKNLAFSLQGAVVPEPAAGTLLAVMGLLSVGMVRRKR